MPHRGCLLFIFPLTFWIYASLSLSLIVDIWDRWQKCAARPPPKPPLRVDGETSKKKIKPHFLGSATTFPPSIILPDPGNPMMERRHFSLISAHFRPHYFSVGERVKNVTFVTATFSLPLYLCVRASLTHLENAATASFVQWLKIRPFEGEPRSRSTKKYALSVRSFYPLSKPLC